MWLELGENSVNINMMNTISEISNTKGQSIYIVAVTTDRARRSAFVFAKSLLSLKRAKYHVAGVSTFNSEYKKREVRR